MSLRYLDSTLSRVPPEQQLIRRSVPSSLEALVLYRQRTTLAMFVTVPPE
jgi:hypothetical protein